MRLVIFWAYSLIPDIDGLLENAQARCSEIFERNLGITIGKMSVHTIVDNGLYNHYKMYMDDSKVDYDYDAAANHYDETKESFTSKGVTGLMILWNINPVCWLWPNAPDSTSLPGNPRVWMNLSFANRGSWTHPYICLGSCP